MYEYSEAPPKTRSAPPSPAQAPAIPIAKNMIYFGLIPAFSATVSLCPTAFISYPFLKYLKKKNIPIVKRIAIIKPKFKFCLVIFAKSNGNLAPSKTRGDCVFCEVGSFKGPFNRKFCNSSII